MGRAPCCEKTGLKKGPWTPEEDEKLIAYIKKHGQGKWRTLPKNAGLARCGKSCRLRWTNYLRPDIKRGRFSFEEEETIILLHRILGNKWSAIAAWLPGRTDNEIKNYWNTNIRKRLLRMGIDPVTHAPRPDFILGLDDPSAAAPYRYPYAYTTQAADDLDTLRDLDLHLHPLANNNSYEPDLLRLASTLLLSGPAAPVIADQQLLPWILQQETMAQQVVAQHAGAACQMPDLMQMGHQDKPQDMMAQQAAAAMAVQQVAPPPLQHAEQFMQQRQAGAAFACQMPDLVDMNSNPTVQQQLAAAQQQDMAAAAACHSIQPPRGYVDCSLDVLAALMMQMVQQPDAWNLQQWSSTVTSSNNIVSSVVSTPSSSPVARLNLSTNTSTTTTYGGASARASTSNNAIAAALFNMQQAELLDVSDYM